jgi:hybrid cluster-associated redox disulfide protein
LPFEKGWSFGIIKYMEKKAKITKEMRISEVIRKYPKTTFVFIDYGLNCLGCPIALAETIEEAARLHQIDLKELLKDLNRAAEEI